ncbi:MFS transporter [Arthrobacter sp. PAMC25564]|uniref:MFS transporter n=1 Tax=Arthrobacter sp. PAMC25564 TaxID=2565366 RepID=UPI0010A29758|nr:MFS transporter [Arthrobacter sp. PAMC25564]QCB96217.1 MFS transporter [Arthrobacter sp. PAMC25564]
MTRESTLPRSPRTITAVLAISGTLVALMQTLVVPLLPDFPRILNVTADDASWLVTATLLSSAIATPIVSRSADMYGKRKMMVVCMAIMVVGSVLAAVGGSFLWLIIGRAMQGFASALIPVGISIMRDELPKEKMGSAVALMSATLGIGSALGLPLAGILYESLGWESIFWVSAGAGSLLLAAVVLVVPESRVRTPGRFDYLGAMVLSAALAALLLAISKGGSWGWGSEPVLLLFLAAALLLAVWVPYELKAGQPMVDLRTSARRPVLLTNLASLLIGFAMFANMLLTTQQLQLPASTGYGFQLSVITAGLCMVPSGLAMVVFAPVSGGIIKRFGGQPALIAGAAVMIAGYVGRVFFWDSIASVIIGSTVVSIGTAIAYAAMPTLIMGAVPITETASANGLNSLVRSIGTSTSSAAVAAVLTSVTITVGTAQLPAFQAFQDVFWMATLASAASIMAVVFIPAAVGGRRAPVPTPVASELVVQGRVLSADHRPLTPAVVTVLQTTGEPVDWSRVDSEGNYSVALPGAGKYLMVANTAGWAPMAEVFDFDGRTLGQNFHLHDRLQLGGVARAAGTPLEGAVVTLLQATGEHVATTRTENDGTYSLPLPAPGRYILTMLHPLTHQAMARKLAVDNRSVNADLELDTPTEQLVDA